MFIASRMTLALLFSLFSLVWVASAFAAPAPPVLSHQVDGLEVTADWTPVEGATGYRLYYARIPFRGEESIENVDLGTATQFGGSLWSGAAYYIVVTAYDDNGESIYSNLRHFSLVAQGSQAPPQEGTITGQLNFIGQAGGQPSAPLGTMLYLDDNDTPALPDADGRFYVDNIGGGDHSLFIETAEGERIEVPFRMAGGRGLDFGLLSIGGNRLDNMTGFDGYHFGWHDADGDGFHDLFADADGDGICDYGYTYAGYSYQMGYGYHDQDGDLRNDRFADANGDGINDLTGISYRYGFGYVDANQDGINDHFFDADGDGFSDVSGMPYRHGFGWADADGDGINDRFVDADGDGVNDRNNAGYVGIPGWVDANGDGRHDLFADADGDGINDLSGIPMSYGHGFGWVDADGDGINDRFVDADGDGINDLATGPFAGQGNCYGFLGTPHDGNGDGINDLTGQPFRHGFGWIDANGDGVNDRFVDSDGDGVNDLFGYHYGRGYQSHDGFGGMPGPGPGGMMGPAYNR